MKKPDFKKQILPYLLVALVFLTIIFVYLMPVLEGKVIKQQDVTQWRGMYEGIRQYREATGETPLWTKNMFSGMPAYQIYSPWEYDLFAIKYLGLPNLLPHPVDSFLLYLIGFFLLLRAFRVNLWLSTIGAIAFAFSSYNLVILEAGHVTKSFAIGYGTMVLAGIVYTYKSRNYILGAFLTGLALGFQINANHVQITYYLMLMVLIFGITEMIYAARKNMLPGFLKASAALSIAAILAVGANSTNLLLTYEYGEQTIRGASELSQPAEIASRGLDKDYALAWSYGVWESFTILIPNFKGGSSMEALSRNSQTYQTLVQGQVPNADRIIQAMPLYFGSQPFTSGPVYIGAIICFLFVLGLLIVKGPVRWWLLTATILALMLSWGRNFLPFTNLFFDYFPFYNKFRAVAMILIIAQIAMPVLAFLALQRVFNNDITKDEILKALKIAFGVTGGLTLLFAVAPGIHSDFIGINDHRLPEWLQDSIVADRRSAVSADAFRSFILITLTAAGLYFYALGKLKYKTALFGLAVLMIIDLGGVGWRYLNHDNFITQRAERQPFQLTAADQAILQDNDPHFRVLNLSISPWQDATTSFHHRSIGGYHGAKLRRYQELYDHRLTQEFQFLSQGQIERITSLNMLNTRYIIASADADGVMRNPGAMGPAWMVNNINWVPNADAEIEAIQDFNPRITAIIDERYRNVVGNIQPSSEGATIRLTDYLHDYARYEVNAASTAFAVFSEIYYNTGIGWQAYLNGEPVDHARVNYVLRGMSIPQGTHVVEFRFEPQTEKKAGMLALISTLLLLTGIAVSGFLVVKREKNTA